MANPASEIVSLPASLPVTMPASVTVPLELRFFGPFEARLNGQPLPPLRTRKGQWLLALLALRSPRPVEREWLAANLWPDSQPDQALSGLRRTLTDLRNALGGESWRLDAPTVRTLRLLTDGARVDLLRFDVAIRGGDLATACDLYSGPFLEDCPEEWAVTERAAREEAFTCARLRLAEAAFGRGDFAEATAHWRRLVTLNPLHEPAQRGLMESLCAGGDHGEAIQAYRDLRTRLRRDFASEPGAQTTALFDRVRREARQQSRAVIARSTPHLVVPKLPVPEEESAASGLDPSRSLPVYLTHFIGRDKETASLLSLLRARRLVTLVGMGGIGKTRLAVASAEQLLDYSPELVPEGAYFADLSAARDAEQAVRAVARAVGIGEMEGGASALARAIGNRSLLLILDNCEQIIAEVASLAETVLAQCPGVRALATSRESLRIHGECVFRVPALTLPAPGECAEGALRHEAIQLFVERAEAVQADFRAAERTLGLVSRICERLDGIALAIELAAARLSALTLEEVADRLDDRLHLLTLGSRTASTRQRTLRAALDWSYDLLPEGERDLLRRLAVFAGGFTVPAVASVCLPDRAEWEAAEFLTALVDKSFVSPVGGGRYRLLETVREYALDLLTTGATEWADTKRRFGGYFAVVVRNAAEQMRQGEQQGAVATLAAEEDNIRAALPILLGVPEMALTGQRVANTMARFWTMRNALGQAVAWCQHALGATVAPTEDGQAEQVMRVRLLGSMGITERRRGNCDAARVSQEQSLALSRACGDDIGQSSALGNLALLAENAGDYEQAQTLRQEGLSIERRLGDPSQIALFLHNVANIAQRRRDLVTAFSHLDECIPIQREAGDREGLAWSLMSYCYALVNRRDAGDAREGDTMILRRYRTESLDLFREFGDKEGVLGVLCLDARESVTHDWAAARSALIEALDLYAEMEGNAATVDLMESLSVVSDTRNMVTEAALFHGAVAGILEAQGSCPTPAEARECEERGEKLRTLLGEAAFTEAVTVGRSFTVSDVLSVARRVTG